jgi:hypothetical protein
MIKTVSFQGCKDGSTHVNQQINTAHKQNQGQKSHNHFS